VTRKLWIEEGVMDSGASVARVLMLPLDIGPTVSALGMETDPVPEPLLHYSNRRSVHSCPCLATITGEGKS